MQNLESFDTEKVALSPLEQFIKEEQGHMAASLREILRSAETSMRRQPEAYIDHGDTEPSVDLRLCIDLTGFSSYRSEGWIFRTGDSSCDQFHSQYCAASRIYLGSEADELLLDLIDQVLEQEASQ